MRADTLAKATAEAASPVDPKFCLRGASDIAPEGTIDAP